MKRLGVGAALVASELVPGDLAVEEGRVAAVGLSPAGRGLALPGFVDLQINGFAGVDFLTASPDDLVDRVGPALAATGVVAYQPTLITARPEQTIAAVTVMAEVAARGGGPQLLGVHLEGPFLSPGKAGAHPLHLLLPPDPEWFTPVLAAGSVTMVTLASELPGALDLIADLSARGIVVSLGHSDATAAQARAGFEAGATCVTHLFNAMRFGHREPGLAGEALAHPGVSLGVVADGTHLADQILLLVGRAAPERMVVVTDAIAAAGRGDGHFLLGEVEVEVAGGEARRSDGVLAGSVGTMDQSFRRLLSLGFSLQDAVAATSTNARRLTSTTGGDLRPGDPADLVVFDDRYEVVRTVNAGE